VLQVLNLIMSSSVLTRLINLFFVAFQILLEWLRISIGSMAPDNVKWW
jgi:hypothetical protein